MPAGLAIDGTRIYWADHATRTIVSEPKCGGSIMVLASNEPDAIVDGATVTDVYWHTSARLARASLGGGGVTTVAGGEVSAVFVRPPNVLWRGYGWAPAFGEFLDEGWHRLSNPIGQLQATWSERALMAPLRGAFAVVADDRFVFARVGHDVLRTRVNGHD